MVRISSLLGVLSYAAAALGVVPLFSSLDLPVQFVVAVAFAAGFYFDRRRSYPLGTTVTTLLTLACFFFYGIQISRSYLIEPVVNLLALLLAVRLVTEKSGRNMLQIFVLAIFALASSSLLSLSAAFFVYLVLLVTSVTVGLVLLTFFAVEPRLVLNRRQSVRVLSVALTLPLFSLLLMLVFFVVLPRTQYPLWNFLNPAEKSTAGFSEVVRPGSFAEISAVKEVALRVESEKIPASQLYWRGIVLNTPTGSTWVRQTSPAGEKAQIRGGKTIPQIIYPEPKSGNYLFALDVPQTLKGLRSARDTDFIYRARGSLERRVKYSAISIVGGEFETIGEVDRDFYLAVPTSVSARMRQVAADIVASGADASGRVARLEEFFTRQQLAYATDGLPGGEDAIDAFLFENKRGYCEFFASSFALLLRLSGVPARLVGGYYGGEYSEMGGYYLVTEDTAHVWVEALVDGRWLRLDPSRLAHNADASLLAPRQKGLSAGRRLLDSIDYHWNRTVIAYDLERQLQFLQQTNRQFRQFKVSFAGTTVVGGLLIGLMGALVLATLRKRYQRSQEERLLERFLRRLRKKHRLGDIPPSAGLHALAKQLDDPACREFAEIYGGGIYRDRKLTREETKKLQELIRGLGNAPRKSN